jgi:hypothetical protein
MNIIRVVMGGEEKNLLQELSVILNGANSLS